MSTITIETLQAELKQLKNENKALLAENPKRLKTQIKRLQEDSRSKNLELTKLKTRVKDLQSSNNTMEEQLQQMSTHFQNLQILEKPHWESEDKSWAIYLDVDQEDESNERPDINLRVVDRKTGGAKVPHFEEVDGKAEIVWPRMRNLSKEVKTAVQGLVDLDNPEG